MVRAGRTPLRVLALSYGADLVYTEEIVDQRLLGSQRVENAALDTVDYTLGDEVVLRVAAEERSRCVLQIGTNSAETATKICQKVGHDFAAIDVNMGCPKPFSIHCGMGAALLSDPERAKEILTAIVSASVVPVSCKIRLLNSQDKTLDFVRMVERCGVSAVAVHGRQRDERPKDQCRVAEINQICRSLSVPVFANGFSGSIHSYEDLGRFREETGASGHPKFFAKVCQYDESFTGSKYVVQRILGSQQEFDPCGRLTVAASTVRQICHIWGMDSERWKSRRKIGQEQEAVETPQGQTDDDKRLPAKRPRNYVDEQVDDKVPMLKMVDGVRVAQLSFHPKCLKCGVNGKLTPKCVLSNHCFRQQFDAPLYQTRNHEHRFIGTVCVNGRKFGSSVAQPNTKMAEQVAALVALHGLEIRHKLEGNWDEQ
uniref:DRBM domain-containing protein n=1 Tax=Globodera rostochiensis TaxID=31243 RepID=A0A914HY17_GLORO